MKKEKRLIPNGYYCYKCLKRRKNGSFKTIGLCPYWSIRKGKGKQENGYCSYLGKGDWELNEEYKKRGEWVNAKGQSIEPPDFFPISGIWDKVKECGINMECEDEDTCTVYITKEDLQSPVMPPKRIYRTKVKIRKIKKGKPAIGG